MVEPNRSSEHCYCVGPDSTDSTDSTSPCDSDCRPLHYYVSDNFTLENNTTLHFLPGTHLLSSVFYAKSLANLHFRGDSATTPRDCSESEAARTAVATVVCQGNHSGFHFYNISNLTVLGIAFNDCGYAITLSKNRTYWNAFLIHYVHNLHFRNVAICKSRGVAVYGYEVVGNSTISDSTISSSKRASPYNSSSSGNIHLYYEYKSKYKTHHYNVSITNSKIINGDNEDFLSISRPHAGGVFIYLSTTNAIHFALVNVNISGNSGYNGGNIAIDHIVHGNSWSTISIQNCWFLNGTARGFGAGLHLNFIADDEKYIHSEDVANSTVIMQVTGSHFENNRAGKVGAGAYIQLHKSSQFRTIAIISFTRCHFMNNSINSTTGRGGSAVNIISFKIPEYIPHHLPQFVASFSQCKFAGNSAVLSEVLLGSSALFVEESAYTDISDCEFMDNIHCSGISAVHSNLLLHGENKITNNTAVNGGGLVLCSNSVFHLSSNATLNISNNNATRDGGGIFNEDDCLQAIPPCFFQPDSFPPLNKGVFLSNNTAGRAGSAIYGGSVDYCYYYGPYLSQEKRSNVFNKLFDITSDPSDRSNISSNPMRVCFCDDNSEDYHCSEVKQSYDVFPGGQVKVKVVVVGQRDGTVPGTVMAQVDNDRVQINPQESSQFVHSTSYCEILTYTIHTTVSVTESFNVTFKLFTENNFRNTSEKDTNIYLDLIVQPCPPGFSQNSKTHECECSKDLQNKLELITCNITETSILRQSKSMWWIGFDNNNSMVYVENCPFDYCVTNPVKINTIMIDTQDSQCAHNRKGVLCGECKENMSIVLGSSHCYDCSDSNIWIVLGKTILILLLGVGLILFIGIFNLNVSEGSLNALVFYMNVVRFNTSYFDISRDSHIFVKWMSVFVALMNLDIGMKVCFYDDMSVFGKMGLQFVFPFYLWCLAGLIVYLGRRKHSWVVKIFGTNTVKVLATIIVHSYAKLIRAVINIWSPTFIWSSSNELPTLVWTANGNISYFHKREHLALFVVAVVVAAVTLPYTLALLFIQCLRKKSNVKVLFWVNKLKPFFDAYTGPYKDRYHFWTGFLLVIRIILFVSITATNQPTLNLTLVIVTTSLLLFLMQEGIYQSRVLNVIEFFSYLNLIVFTALTSYNRYNNQIAIMVCIGSMFLLFCGIIICHILKKLSVTRRWGLVRVWFLDQRWPWMKRKQIRSLILPYVDPDNDEDLSSSDGELDPILHNAPPVARYNEYREPLIETNSCRND